MEATAVEITTLETTALVTSTLGTQHVSSFNTETRKLEFFVTKKLKYNKWKNGEILKLLPFSEKLISTVLNWYGQERKS